MADDDIEDDLPHVLMSCTNISTLKGHTLRNRFDDAMLQRHDAPDTINNSARFLADDGIDVAACGPNS